MDYNCVKDEVSVLELDVVEEMKFSGKYILTFDSPRCPRKEVVRLTTIKWNESKNKTKVDVNKK